jgi:hypothetical protein
MLDIHLSKASLQPHSANKRINFSLRRNFNVTTSAARIPPEVHRTVEVEVLDGRGGDGLTLGHVAVHLSHRRNNRQIREFESFGIVVVEIEVSRILGMVHLAHSLPRGIVEPVGVLLPHRNLDVGSHRKGESKGLEERRRAAVAEKGHKKARRKKEHHTEVVLERCMIVIADCFVDKLSVVERGGYKECGLCY